MRRPAAAVILIISLLMAVRAIATPIEDAKRAYDSGDFKTAFRLFKPYADRGIPDAQCIIANMYSEGQGVPQNNAEAMKLFRMGADQGSAYCQLALGSQYVIGQIVPQDYVLAYMWLNLAASRFSLSERYDRESAIKLREVVASKMTPAQIAEAQKLAREWKPKKER